MTIASFAQSDRLQAIGAYAIDVSRIGRYLTLYGLVLVFAWIGMMKFTAYEAGAIEGLVASSPFLSWLYAIFDQRGAANLIGSVEIGAAVLLATRPWSALAGAIGAAPRGDHDGGHIDVSVLVAWLGTEPGRVPGPLRVAGSVPFERRRVVGGSTLAPWATRSTTCSRREPA